MTLSAIAAAAIHGGVLLGLPRGDVPGPIVSKDPPFICIFPIIPPEEPLPVPLSDGEPGPAKGTPRPTGVDQPTIGPTDFPIPPVPVPAIDPGRMEKIPIGPLGVETGIDDIKRRGVFSPDVLDNSPRTRAQPPPIYPFEKKRTGEHGEVTIEFTVDESGRVIDPRVTHTSDRAFESAALQALAKWRFEPGTRHGQIVRFRMVQTFTFALTER